MLDLKSLIPIRHPGGRDEVNGRLAPDRPPGIRRGKSSKWGARARSTTPSPAHHGCGTFRPAAHPPPPARRSRRRWTGAPRHGWRGTNCTNTRYDDLSAFRVVRVPHGGAGDRKVYCKRCPSTPCRYLPSRIQSLGCTPLSSPITRAGSRSLVRYDIDLATKSRDIIGAQGVIQNAECDGANS